MLDYIHLSAYVGVLSILVFLVPLCINDIKYRKIPQWMVWALVLINTPAVIIMYSNGLPIFYPLLSILMTVFFVGLYYFNAIKGGDLKILILISWFCPLNPLNPNDTFFQIQYVIFLAWASIMWMIYVYFSNRHAQDEVSFNEQTIWQKFNNYPGGSPWMVPIALAFIMGVIFG